MSASAFFDSRGHKGSELSRDNGVAVRPTESISRRGQEVFLFVRSLAPVANEEGSKNDCHSLLGSWQQLLALVESSLSFARFVLFLPALHHAK